MKSGAFQGHIEVICYNGLWLVTMAQMELLGNIIGLPHRGASWWQLLGYTLSTALSISPKSGQVLYQKWYRSFSWPSCVGKSSHNKLLIWWVGTLCSGHWWSTIHIRWDISYNCFLEIQSQENLNCCHIRILAGQWKMSQIKWGDTEAYQISTIPALYDAWHIAVLNALLEIS